MKESSSTGFGRGITITLLYSLFCVTFACEEKQDRTVEKEVGEIRFVVKYRPFKDGKTENEGNALEQFTIELKHVDNKDIVQHLSETSGFTPEEVLYYLSYRFKDDVFLEENERRKNNVLYHFERSFDLKSGRVLNVGFAPVDEKTENVTLLIDSDLLNTGPVKIKFLKE